MGKIQEKPIILFVHGMGRTPLSGWPILRRLRRAGFATQSFAYMTSVENFARIQARLTTRIITLSRNGDYVLIGHSLGGVLLRAALNALPLGTVLPRHLFLLGSPTTPSRLAIKLAKNSVYRFTTGDCGQLLGSVARMGEIGGVTIPVTSIIGITGLNSRRSPFGDEPNDGVVAASECGAPWIAEEVRIPCVHTWLPASGQVADVIRARVKSSQKARGY